MTRDIFRRLATALLLTATASGPALAQNDPARPEPPAAPARVAGFEGDHRPLHSLAGRPGRPTGAGLPEGAYYVPSTPETVRWGRLPNRSAEPVLTVPSGAVVVVDAVSHEGILEDQGRDPAGFFARFGVPARHVLDDAKAIAAAAVAHDFATNGPHVVTGPVALEGAAPGDVLMTEILRVAPRVPYGVVSNRHGKGALPGEILIVDRDGGNCRAYGGPPGLQTGQPTAPVPKTICAALRAGTPTRRPGGEGPRPGLSPRRSDFRVRGAAVHRPAEPAGNRFAADAAPFPQGIGAPRDATPIAKGLAQDLGQARPDGPGSASSNSASCARRASDGSLSLPAPQATQRRRASSLKGLMNPRPLRQHRRDGRS